jgi:integrase
MAGRKSRPGGHIRDLGGQRWLIRTSHGRGADGKRIRVQEVFEGTKKQALSQLTLIRRRWDDGLNPALGRQSFGEWGTEWLRDWASNKGPRTRFDSERMMERLLKQHREFGGLQLSQLSGHHIQQVVNALSARGLDATTVRKYHALIRGCLSRAEKLGKVARNVAKLVELPAQHRKERTVLTAEQAKRFLKAAEEDRYYALFAVLLFAGLRPGEACALRWDDLDGPALRVRRAVIWLPKRAPFTGDTKTGRSRVVMLGKEVLDILRRHRVRQAELRLQLGATYKDQGLIFATVEGGLLDRGNLQGRHFKSILERAELSDLRLYDLRHTHATLLMAAGVHPKVVQERLGHSTITLTLDTYSHVVPGMQERAAERFDTLLGEAVKVAGTGG